MSTNAIVAYVGLDGTVTSSYVHWDGYTTAVGEMLLENYNSEETAKELATTLGYASSLRETVVASHEDRANSDEAIVHTTFAEFEEYARENSYLEYVYVWTSTKWFVGSYTTEKKEVFTGEGRDYEFTDTWNGWEELVTVYIREGNATVERYKKMVSEDRVGAEYLEHARELNNSVTKWMRIGMRGIVREVLAA
jgi:hypothetical protein